ncbi:type II secretion system protein GspM [Jeongeupia naejangsanensis]|uniref:Type II secretion system protein M n=1 Tax=Jeongeupia naejangsanensis TaxID=613195 RepID=A0ABS2BI64_9NEIS|nr:type II secretion system protein GspM [Jeongeupia naejangsanensis]MBM3115302.1 type II secretion system protein M [Jeongeupia naejangsanensis]
MASIQTLRNWWRERAQRERQALTVGGIALVAAVLYAGIWQPATQASARLARQLPELQTSLADLQRGVAEFKQTGARANVAPGALRQHVQAALDAQQIGAELQALPGEQVRVVIGGAPFDRVLALLGALENDQHLRVIRADVHGQGGTVQAELVVEP